jgi:hypothetical protein
MDDHDEHERHSRAQSTQWQSHDLKAQEDLLSLKVLQDPGFLERVPTLSPPNASSPAHSGMPRSHSLDALHQESGFAQARESSMLSTPVSDAQQRDFMPHGSTDLSIPTPSQIQDTHLRMITQEVTHRVLDQLEAILPELIASTLEEVLRGPDHE